MRPKLFLPTPSVRRATGRQFEVAMLPAAISTHALREEGDLDAAGIARVGDDISTHALREEGDAASLWICLRIAYFYPRPP